MPGTKNEGTKAEQRYSLLLPRLFRAGSDVTLTRENSRVRDGIVPKRLKAVRLPGGSIGVHAAAVDSDVALHADTRLVSPSKDNAPIVHETDATRGKSADVAKLHVTCKFCLARLISAGRLQADEMSSGTPAASRAYALDYGTRGSAGEQLAAIDAAEQKAAKAAAKAAADKAKARAKAKADKAKA